MIVKNGEILAIDHIAHDNTLSGNGTSAKPVGLSQSTKNLIDSKVKKTDFETYKSSAANQISNINTKITTDESNFESYKTSAHNEIANFKSSAHDEIARVDASIAAVNAAKVDNNTFTQYQTEVANSFTAVNKRIDDVDAAKVDNTTFDNFKGSANGELTGIKQSITDLDNAKQAKGDYVSASDFNNLKSFAHNEIARVDGRIDATNTNLSNNYYDRTTIDKKFADFGGYKFREPDPNNNNQPILNQGEDPDPKAIYLTQPEGATQYLQWIWDEEITEENKWKCIGDTTMDLSDYAKTVDVVASANNNVNAVKNWTNDNFETISDFNTVIAGYYTKGQVDTVLENIAQEFVDTSAWANDTFATKTDLTGDKAELEGKINALDTKVETELSAVSGKIIGELNSSEQALDERINSVSIDLGNVSSTLENEITDVDNKVDTLTDELHNDYYTSNQIDAILAASGEYYTVDEVNEKLEEYAKSTDLDPIKDDINSISAEFDNYYTKTDADEKFVTKTTFNVLDEFVNAIDDDLDTVFGDVVTLSGKVNGLHNTVIESSDTVIATPTTKPDGTISYTLSAHDGKQADYLWKPTVNAAGDISWELALTGDTPATANIKGSDGDDGKTPELTSENYHIKWKYTDESIWNDLGDFRGASGADGKDGEDGITPKLKIDENDIWNVSYDNEETWTSLGVSATGPKGETGAQGPQGISGTPGKNGENGITPHIGENNHWFIGDVDTNISATGPQGPAGKNGTNGKDGTDGKDGVSPTVTTATIAGGNRVTFTYGEGSTEYIDVMSGVPGLSGVSPTVTITNIPADPLDPDHQNGGTEITITDATSTNKFSAWNGNDGTMAGAPDIEGKNGISAILAGSTYEVGLSGEFYTAITSVSSTYATKDALDAYLTKNDAAELYQSKGDYLSANALNGYATQSWVEGKNYLVANDIAGKADKTDLQYVSAGVDYVSGQIPSLNGYATEQYVQGASAEVTAWVGQQNYLTSVPSEYITETELSTALLGYLTKLSADDLYQPKGNYLTTVATSGSVIGTGLAANKIGLVTTAENALTAVANKVNTSDILTAANNTLTGIKIGSTSYTVPTTDLSNYYTKSETSDTFVQKTAVKTGTYGNVTAVSAIDDVPIKDTNLWAITGTYENNNNYQHYIENTNTFNYYTVMVHPANTSSAASWANDNIIHIILE